MEITSDRQPDEKGPGKSYPHYRYKLQYDCSWYRPTYHKCLGGNVTKIYSSKDQTSQEAWKEAQQKAENREQVDTSYFMYTHSLSADNCMCALHYWNMKKEQHVTAWTIVILYEEALAWNYYIDFNQKSIGKNINSKNTSAHWRLVIKTKSRSKKLALIGAL